MLSGCPRQSVVVNVVSVLLVLLEVRRPLPQNQGYYSDQVSEVSEGQGRTGQKAMTSEPRILFRSSID